MALEIHLLLDQTLTESESRSLRAKAVSAAVKKRHEDHGREIPLGFSEGFETMGRGREDSGNSAVPMGSAGGRAAGSENRQGEGGMQNRAAHIINPVTI